MSKYYDTLQLKSAPTGNGNRTLIAYITKKWPIPNGAKVWFTIRGIDEPASEETRVKKVLRKTGVGRKITCNRIWGYKEDDWVVISLEPASGTDLDDDFEEFEDGVGDEEEDQEVSA